MYIDNSSKDVRGKKGLQPSLFADIMSITPDKLFPLPQDVYLEKDKPKSTREQYEKFLKQVNKSKEKN